ncbi:hypothetical protein GQ55_9G088800 [Panicum hallii var. hallii]|uniref:Uncharacterized protein n=1 Tax=Panicum hallii var. hallii TaxID=1504633 RepID=A0A2T7C152_9POAL|nr:hypothetical protein GQ55_9G088800 [Panicum hallii var. hallii]
MASAPGWCRAGEIRPPGLPASGGGRAMGEGMRARSERASAERPARAREAMGSGAARASRRAGGGRGMRELAGGARRRGKDDEGEKGRGGRNLTTLAGVDVLRKEGRRWVAEEDDGSRTCLPEKPRGRACAGEI